jgi:hypothetical protein
MSPAPDHDFDLLSGPPETATATRRSRQSEAGHDLTSEASKRLAPSSAAVVENALSCIVTRVSVNTQASRFGLDATHVGRRTGSTELAAAPSVFPL